MKTSETTSDTDMLLEHAATGKPMDDEVYRRIRERQEAITAKLREEHGLMNIAVDLIRETRDQS